MEVKDIQFTQLNQLSSRDKDYLLHSEKFKDFLQYEFDFESFGKVIEARKNYRVDRQLLVSKIKEQYKDVSSSDFTKKHIEALLAENTYTLTTAHQPSLLTGPLYYIYKILSVINLSTQLKETHPNHSFVPVFVIGGEDHDFEEINHFCLYGKKLEWSSEDSGSVGQFTTKGIKQVLAQAREILGERSQALELLTDLEKDLERCRTYGDFSFKLTHRLFDHLGIVILRMDDADLKRAFIPVIKAEILKGESKAIIEKTQEQLIAAGYKAQTHIRDINFFYKTAGLRNRIEKDGLNYKVVDTDIVFTEAEISSEIDNHPDRFSPNVIMRPLYQSLILPDLAYIGGGGELAYWMERKTQFAHFDLHFPMLVRRQSAMIVTGSSVKQTEKLGLQLTDLFSKEADLVKTYLSKSDNPDYKLDSYKEKIQTLYLELEKHIGTIDQSLSKTTQSEAVKSSKSIDYLESKLKKSIKSKEEVNIKRIEKLKSKLFPSGLQERHDNIFEFISSNGVGIIDEMLPHCDPMAKVFKAFVL